MTDDPQNPRGRPNTTTSRRRGGARLPWMDPHAPSAWWSAPAREPRARVVEQTPLDAAAADGAASPSPTNAARAPKTGRVANPRPHPPQSRPTDTPDILGALGTAFDRARARVRAVAESEDGLKTLGTLLGRVVLALLLVAALALAIPHLGQLFTFVTSRGPTPTVAPPPTHVPTATPTPPKQTELDGVITITNLDQQLAFEGDVQVQADNGTWYCRNAPLPHSTWHVRLGPGETVSLPCVIPVTTPSSLPPHTFRQAVPSADGTGLALVDNPESFLGTSFVPTATATTAAG